MREGEGVEARLVHLVDKQLRAKRSVIVTHTHTRSTELVYSVVLANEMK